MMTDTAGTRTRDRSDDEPWVVAGVDTHKDTHHVAVLNAATGAGLGDMRVPATPAGYDRLHDFVRSHGRIRMIGIEGTGSYGAGLARALRAAGAPIREVIRPKRSQRRRGRAPIRSEPEPPPAEHRPEADALPVAKTGTGPCEQIRVLPARRRSAMKARVAAHRQITALPATAPDAVRTRFARLSGGELIDALARTRPAPATHRPRIGDRASAAPPGPPPPDPDRRDRRHRHRAARTDRPRRPDDARHQGLRRHHHRHPARHRRRQPRPNPHRGLLRRPVRRRPDPRQLREDQPPPTQPRRRPTGQLGAAPQRPARPATRAPRPAPPASPPRARTAKRHCAAPERAIAREAWHLLTHPQPAPRTDDLRRLRHERGLTLTQAAHHLNTHPARISELERGTRPDTTLTAAYRQWLNTQQPQTHTA